LSPVLYFVDISPELLFKKQNKSFFEKRKWPLRGRPFLIAGTSYAKGKAPRINEVTPALR
jgi:hypothetical protein